MLSPEPRHSAKGAKRLAPLIVKSSESGSCRLPLPTRIAFIGNYLPRECGIATFTTDLCTALATEFGDGPPVRNSGQRSGFELRISRAGSPGDWTQEELGLL